MVSSNVSVIDPPTLPTSPFKPSKVRNLGLAIILGLFLGVVLALLVDALDDTIKSTEDLERLCNLPLLGTLPASERSPQVNARPEKSKFLGQAIFAMVQTGRPGYACGGLGYGDPEASPRPDQRSLAPHGNFHHVVCFGTASCSHYAYQS